MSATNGFVLTVDHSEPPKVAVDGEYRHKWKAPSAGPRLVAEGTDTVGSTGVNGVVLRDLTSLVALGETFMISAALAPGATSMALDLEKQGVAPPGPALTDGVKLYLSYVDPSAHAMSICANNFNDGDAIVHWRVHAFPAT